MSKMEKRVIVLLFVVFFLVGLVAVQGYGINVDENTEIDIARMDLKEYVRLVGGEESSLFRYMDSLIGDLMDSVEIAHGEALLYPAAAVVSVLRMIGRTDLGMLFYHMYLYVWFLVGLLAAYQTGKFLTGKISGGAMAAACLGLNPLLFGMSFINNKDMIMLSLTCICIYLGIRFVEQKTWKWSVAWGISAAFCLNMRIIGLAYIGLFGLLYLYEFWTKKRDRTTFRNGVIALLTVIVVFLAVTPATWYSPIGYFTYTISSSAEFLRLDNWELYRGEIYNYLQKPLPWHYFFVMFGVSTPIVFLAIFLLGQAGSACLLIHDLKRKAVEGRMKYILIFQVIVWVPMLYFVIKGAHVTFRHFWFMYPELAFTGVYARCRLCRGRKAERIAGAMFGAQAVVCAVMLIAGHPFQTTYFNVLAGPGADTRFAYVNTDYYKEALERILTMDDGDDILISSDNLNCYFGVKQAWEILHPDKKARIRIAPPDTEECAQADYHVYGQSVLVQENMMAEQGVGEAVFCEPEEKYDSSLPLKAYGKTVVTIWYNSSASRE
ncbi:MAG: glycosyltransferase family 39 protein [Eubacteriales bacterium]|nr:glycosyltransferase family 39 protein [Eubacteriales bacterium]